MNEIINNIFSNFSLIKKEPNVGLEQKLNSFSLLGETIKLKNGEIIQKPNSEVIRILQKIDSRIHYFPTDIIKADETSCGYSYYRGVTDLLPYQIMKDFPGAKNRTYQRGTVVSLRDEFPLFLQIIGEEKPKKGEYFSKTIYSREKAPINNVLTMLKNGSDRKYVLGNLGAINEKNELNTHTNDYLMNHTNSAIKTIVKEGEIEKSDNLFPGLLVYDVNKLKEINNNISKNPKALIAIYITDRIQRK